MEPAAPDPLVEEAARKAAVAWVAVPGGPPGGYALWCLWQDGALWLVHGPGEQAAPGLADADTATVTLRGDHGGRVVTWPARVSRVDPAAEEWASGVPALVAKRLNASGGTEQIMARWAAECVVSRLVPTGPPTEAGETLPAKAHASAPRDTPVARAVRRPFRLHRVRRRPSDR